MADISTKDILKSLESLYLDAQYDQAIDLLLTNKEKFDGGIFHYNLGTLHIKKEDYAVGRYHLEKAWRLGLINNKVLNNLHTVKYHLVQNGLREPVGFVNRVYTSVMYTPTSLYLFLSLVLLVFAILYIRFKRLSQKWLITLLVLISLLPFAVSKFYLSEMNYAVTLKPAPLHEGPSAIYDLANEIPPGAKLILGELKNGWYFVKTPINYSGWIKKDYIGVY